MGRERPPFWIEITALLVACSAVGGQPVGEDDLIGFLAQQVQQSRQRIKSVVYRYEYEAVRYVSVDGPSRSRGGGSVTLRGEDRATILHRQVTSNGAAQPEIESRTLLTCYAGSWCTPGDPPPATG